MRETALGPQLGSEPQRRQPSWLLHHSHAGAGPSCDLGPSKDSVHLMSFVYGPSALLNEHFLDHYLRLGVAPSRMRLFLEEGGSSPAEADGTRRTRQALAAARVPRAGIVRVPHGNYSDNLMLRLANEHIATLPPSAYVIRADTDEHFSFPCDMADRLREHDLWCADMIDRMSDDGKVRQLRPLPVPCVRSDRNAWSFSMAFLLGLSRIPR